MKKWYKTAAALLLLSNYAQAQTHYGSPVGTIGDGHAFFGMQAGASNQGAHNTFLGTGSGQYHSTGGKNTFLGYQSGQSDSFGADNTYLGTQAGKLGSGNKNVLVGTQAGETHTGNGNVLIGYKTGALGSGEDNVLVGGGIGWGAKGDGNVMMGTFVAMSSNSISNKNTLVGDKAGLSNENSNGNSFFGASAGYNNKTGIFNSFLGYGAGSENVNGQYNTSVGYYAGSNAKTGSYNTYLGFGANGIEGLSNATALGSNAKVTKSNSVVIGGPNANIGLGTSAPAYQLHLNTNFAAKAGSSSWIVASDQRLKKDISDYTEGLDLLKQIKPVWFSYNGAAGMPTDKKFVGIVAQEMQRIVPHSIGTFTYQDSLGNKTDYLDYDANALTYMLVNSVKEQQQMIEEKDAKIQEMGSQVEDLTKRLAQLERIVASNMTKPLTTPASRLHAEPNENGVVLEQNVPNGFSSSTSIHFFIPEKFTEATMNIYSVDGTKIWSEEISQRGDGSVNLSANDFSSGVFIYDLITDGKSNGAKKMIVNK